jgi:hypothetical protein
MARARRGIIWWAVRRRSLPSMANRSRRSRVRNGDLLEIGGVRLLLSVRPASQRSFRLLEILVWLFSRWDRAGPGVSHGVTGCPEHLPGIGGGIGGLNSFAIASRQRTGITKAISYPYARTSLSMFLDWMPDRQRCVCSQFRRRRSREKAAGRDCDQRDSVTARSRPPRESWRGWRRAVGVFTVDFARNDEELTVKMSAAALRGYDGIIFANTTGNCRSRINRHF